MDPDPMFRPGDKCKCGKPGHLVYEGLCEECWLTRPSLRVTHHGLDQWILDRLAEEGMPDRTIPKYSAHHRK